MIRVVIEVSAEEYEAALERDVYVGGVVEVELRQRDGLLNESRRAVRVEGLSVAEGKNQGAEGGPAIRVYCAREE